MSVMKALIFAHVAVVAQGSSYLTCGPRTVPVNLAKRDGRLYFEDSNMQQHAVAESSSWKVEVFEQGVLLNNGTEPGTYRLQNGTVDLSMSPLLELCRRDLEALKKNNNNGYIGNEIPGASNGSTVADSFEKPFFEKPSTFVELIGGWLDYFGVFANNEKNSEEYDNNDSRNSSESIKGATTNSVTVTPKLYFKVNLTEKAQL